MVLRDHTGKFLAGGTTSFEAAATAFEAEAVGVREALSWIKHMHLESRKIVLETGSLLVVNEI